MTALYRISKYYLENNHRLYIVITGAMLLLHITASYMVDMLVAPEREAGIIAPLVIVVAFVIGETIFPSSFTYLLSQGISRKTYWLTTWLNLAAASLVCAFLVGIYFMIMGAAVTSIGSITLFESIYHVQNVAALIIWEFAVLFMMATVGWMDRVANYRASRKLRIAMFAGFVIFWIVLAIMNNMMDGIILRKAAEFFSRLLGLAPGTQNPYIAVLSFLTITAGLSGITFLLLRRAPVND